MEITFFKFHGTGNDFILIDDRKLRFPIEKEVISSMCDRHFGIGADGLILLREKHGADFEMIYFNADGNESTMCGNGGRCITAFADVLSLIDQTAHFTAIDGRHESMITAKYGNTWQVRLKMSDVSGYETMDEDVFINTGSPHLVKFVPEPEKTDVNSMGRQIRYSEQFKPAGTNVDFVEARENGLFVRTYERGVEDETMSCGTGVTASALAYSIKSNMPRGVIIARTKGGDLSVSFMRIKEGFTNIWLEGPVQFVFTGIFFTGG